MDEKSDLVDLTMHLHHETKKGAPGIGAILVSDDGEEKNAVWLPKKFAEFTELGNGKLVEVALPEWLAMREGLI